MKHQVLLLLLLIFSLTLNSCKSKKEAREFLSLFNETVVLNENSDKECKQELRILENKVADGGSKPEDTTLLYKAIIFDAQLLEIQNSIRKYQDTIFYKKLNKDYNFFNFDTLALLNIISVDPNYFKTAEAQFQKAIQDYGYNTLQKIVTERKRQFQFLEFGGKTINLKLPEGQTKAVVMLLILSSLQLEISEIRIASIKRQLVLVDHSMRFVDLKPVVKVKNNIVEEGGEMYSAEISFVALGRTYDKLSMSVNGSPIPVINDIGEVNFIVPPGKYDANGLAKKFWKGEVSYNFKGIDTTFVVIREYYVKKKCDAK